MVTKTTAKLISRVPLSDSVSHFTFQTENELVFREGQFINIIFQNNEEKPIRRAYSLASRFDCKNPNHFELCIKLEKEGQLTPKLFNASEGAVFDIMGPLGLFGLKNVTNSKDGVEKLDQIFIAAGTGIAPMRSLIHSLLETLNFNSKVTLLFGARTEHDILYHEEFKSLQRRYSNFRYLITLSRPSPEWRGLKGYVQDNISEIDLNLGSRVYICGKNSMVDSVHLELDTYEIPKNNRSHEKFG